MVIHADHGDRHPHGDVIMAMVRIRILVKPLFAVEHQKIHAERIKSGHKYTRQHRKLGKPRTWQMALMNRLNDAVFGIETSEQWCTDQCQRAQQRSDPRNGHVLAQAAHPANVLVVVHAHDDRACRQGTARP